MLVLVPVGMVTLILLVAAQDSYEAVNARGDKSKLLAKSLRRQLMRENYDYSQELNNETEFNVFNEIQNKKKKTRKNFYVSDLVVEEKENIKMSFPTKSEKNVKALEDIVSKKDLLYYIDEEKITEKPVTTKSTAEYKYLKVRHQYRRSGQTRLIQEENKEGIAIVNLDRGPIPEMRLPNARRQYMHDHGEAVAEEEEVPPPVVNTSDPEAAPEGVNTTHIE